MTQPPMSAPPADRSPHRRAMLKIGAAVAALVSLVVVLVVVLMGGGSRPPAAGPPTSDAAPYVRDFANQLSGAVRTPLAQPETFSHGPNIDGCDHAYGVRGECVPYNFPSGVGNTRVAKCAWLASHRFQALEVPGKDRHGLVPSGGPRAPSGNPYACPDVLPRTAGGR